MRSMERPVLPYEPVPRGWWVIFVGTAAWTVVLIVALVAWHWIT
jgi:hypothetical protein